MTTKCGPRPSTWFGRGQWPDCTCGFAPRDNAALDRHWADSGFRVVDDHGHLKVIPLMPPTPLFISSRLMAAFQLKGVGTFHLHMEGRDDGHPRYHYIWEDADGKVITEGTDFHGGHNAKVDYPQMFATWFSFIEADAEHYAYTLQMGTETTCDEHDQHDMEYLAHCYQHSDEISMAHYDLTHDEETD